MRLYTTSPLLLSFLLDKHLHAELAGGHPNASNFMNGTNNPTSSTAPVSVAYPSGYALPPLQGSGHGHGGQGHVRGGSASSGSVHYPLNGSGHNSRRGSLDYSGSDRDAGSGGTGSIPSSAASSSVHLPLSGSGMSTNAYGNVSVVSSVLFVFFAFLVLCCMGSFGDSLFSFNLPGWGLIFGRRICAFFSRKNRHVYAHLHLFSLPHARSSMLLAFLACFWSCPRFHLSILPFAELTHLSTGHFSFVYLHLRDPTRGCDRNISRARDMGHGRLLLRFRVRGF